MTGITESERFSHCSTRLVLCSDHMLQRLVPGRGKPLADSTPGSLGITHMIGILAPVYGKMLTPDTTD